MAPSFRWLDAIGILMLWIGSQAVLGCTEQEDGDAPASAITQEAASATAQDGVAAPTGHVLYPDDGEVLVPCRPGSAGEGRWVIKADSVTTGSTRMAMGTQLLPGGEQIPVHRHEHQDEILFIHEGNATGVVGDSSLPIEPGTTVYVPRGLWHGVQNTEDEPVKIVWIVSPPGLEGFFRSIGVAPGADCVPLPADEMEEVRRRHGITERIE